MTTAARPALLAVGTYTRSLPHVEGRGAGIHLLRFDPVSGRLSPATVQRGPENPTYLASVPDESRLYGIRELAHGEGPGLDVFALDRDAAHLEPLAHLHTPGDSPCHVTVDARQRLLLVSNYGSGEVLAYGLDADGRPWDEPQVLSRSGRGPHAGRQDGPHAHCAGISPDGRFVYLCDLGCDRVVRHRIVDGHVNAEPDRDLPVTPGAGPRHLAFTASGRHLLVNNELASTLTVYRLDGDAVTRQTELSTLTPEGPQRNTVGALRLHPSRPFVYVSNRGQDNLFVARLDEADGSLAPVGHWPAGGRTPRDIAISPDGSCLLAASQDDDLIRVFRIDQETGALARLGSDYPIASAVCLHFV